MNCRHICLAVDLGAGSGRVIAGLLTESRLSLEEVCRFSNEPVQDASGWHWNIEQIFADVRAGIAKAIERFGDRVRSVAVDTWGDDYGLLDAEGRLLAPPFQYRDSRTVGMEAEAFRAMPRSEIYRRTGIQFMFFNTLFQLLAEQRSPARLLEKAHRLLFMPDLVNHHLTGRAVVERSIASTSQLLDATTRGWDEGLIAAVGLPRALFGEIVDSGARIGTIRAGLDLGALQVIAPGGHDTASAVAGIPAEEEFPVFLSSGTWSLLGQELPAPVLDDTALDAGFSNEAGVFGTTRFLKNIAGMWLLQECKRVWDRSEALSYDALIRSASDAPAFAALLDPDAPDFQAPEDMPRAIAGYLKATGQTMPGTPGALTRVILESLALKYRQTLSQLRALTHRPAERVHIVGGGSQNSLLNQFAADAMNCEVVAGPVEATSAGNILMQLCALGEIPSLREGRALIRRSFPTTIHSPRDTAAWDAAYARFTSLPTIQ